MSRLTRIVPFFAALAAVTWAASCGGDGGTTVTPPPEPTNQAPVAVGSIPANTMTAGESVTLDVSGLFNDPDGDALTYTATTSDAGVVTASISGSSITVTAVAAGTATVTITARDPGGLTATQSASVTVEAANQAPEPVGSLGTLAFEQGGEVTVHVADNFSDPDGDALTYTAASSDTTVVTVTVSEATVAVFGVAVGSATVTVTATDPGGLSATQDLGVTIEQGNQAPQLVDSIPPQMVTVGDSVRIDASMHFTDPEGAELSYEAVSSDTGVAPALASGDTVTIGGLAAGSAIVTVSASDPEGLSATQNVMVTVEQKAPNRAPVMAVDSIPFPAHDLVLDSAVVLDVSGYFTDPDKDELTYTASTSDDAVAMSSVSGTTVTTTAVSAVEDTVVTVTLMVTATDPEGLSLTQEAEVFVSEMDYEVLEAIRITEEGVLTATVSGVTVTVSITNPNPCLDNSLISTLTSGDYQVHWTEWQQKRGSGWIRVPGTREEERICAYDFTDAEAGVYRVVGELTAPNDVGEPTRKRNKTENEYTHNPGG